MYCVEDSLDPKKVKGKIVLCELEESGADSVVSRAGGMGTILDGSVNPDTAQIFMAPGTMVNMTTAKIISKYIQSTR